MLRGEENFKEFYVGKLGRCEFVCHIINNKIEGNKEKNEDKIF